MNGVVVKWRAWVPAVVIVLAVLIDLLTPPAVNTAPLLAVAPVAAAPLLGTAGITVVGVTAMAAHAALACHQGACGWEGSVANQVSLVVVTALAIGINRLLRSGHARLDQARHTAALAQQAVLPAPPPRLGPLHIAARYVAADREALIGGDLYAVQETPYGIRLLLGDIRGKGLGAIGAVSADVGAFRFAADKAADLPGVVELLEEALVREGDRQRGLARAEGFTTALIAEFPDGCGEVRIVNRGHPPPVLLGPDGRATLLEPTVEAPPLGITALGTWDSPVDVFPFPAGATLVCFTDGVTEARNQSGEFYAPADRLPLLWRRHAAGPGTAPAPETLLRALTGDVARHRGRGARDDQALLALFRPGPDGAPASGGTEPPPR